MNSERTIIKKWKMQSFVLGVILLVQCLAVPLFYALLKEFIGQRFVCNVILLLLLAGCVVFDLHYWFCRVMLLRGLLDKEPINCRVEDVLLFAYKDDRKTRYEPYLLVRSIEDQKLYFAYEKYSLVDFNTIVNYSDKDNIRCTVYKGNGSPLRLGDVVDMYMLKTVSIPVIIDETKNIIRLKKKKIKFRHMNEKTDINVFRNVIFFKGAIDVDRN